MLDVTAAHLRLFLHVLAASVWVGGQLTVVGLLPAVRALGPDAPRAVARRFARVAWAAYAALVLTGVWNLVDVDVTDQDDEYIATLVVKLGLVVLSGLGAALHARSTSRAGLAAWGAVGAIGGLAALLLGIVLRG